MFENAAGKRSASRQLAHGVCCLRNATTWVSCCSQVIRAAPVGEHFHARQQRRQLRAGGRRVRDIRPRHQECRHRAVPDECRDRRRRRTDDPTCCGRTRRLPLRSGPAERRAAPWSIRRGCWGSMSGCSGCRPIGFCSTADTTRRGAVSTAFRQKLPPIQPPRT